MQTFEMEQEFHKIENFDGSSSTFLSNQGVEVTVLFSNRIEAQHSLTASYIFIVSISNYLLILF